MIKPMKKFCSFAVAVCLTVGSICVPASAQTNAKAADTTDKAVDLLADAVYDEAVTFTESIAFLENGNWASSEWIDDERVQYGNVTKETNIVLVDSEGNEKVIANSDGKGGTLFDAVFPMISSGQYHFDALKLMKDNKMTYLNADGSFIGGKEAYYYYAYPITEDILLASDDKEVYRVINSKGEVTVDNIKNINDYILNVVKAYGDLRYIFCDDNCYVLDSEGNLLKEVGEKLSVTSAGNGYAVVKKESSETRWLIDRTGKVIKTFDNYAYVYTSYIEEGYILYFYEGEYILQDMETDEILSKTDGVPSLKGDVVHAYDNGKESIYSLDGTVYIDDVDQYINDLATEGGYTEISSFIRYTDSSIIVSMFDLVDTSKSVTYVLTEENGFKKDKNKTFEGGCSELTTNSKYFITEDYDGYIKNMCTVDGELIKSYANNDKYMYSSLVNSNYGGNIQGEEEFVFWVTDSSVEIESEYWTSYGRAYILANGEISKTYKSLVAEEAFIRGNNIDGTIDIINSDNKVVYNGQGNISISGYYYRECFSITEDNRIKLYDREGNVIFGEDKKYSKITDYGSSNYDSEYYANEMDDFSVYSYRNDMLPNGMCVVRIDTDEVYKYGAIRVADNIKISDATVSLSSNKFTYDGKAKTPSVKSVVVNGKTLVEGKDYTVSYKNNTKVGNASVVITGIGDYDGVCNVSFKIVYGTGMYKGSDGQWYYYTNGKVDKTYIGLAKNTYGWWYMNKGILDTSYTGLVKYKTNWVYVVNGKLNSTYTGLVKYKSNWVYVNKGKLDASYTGLVKYKSNWVYVNKGKLDASYTGLVKYKSNWVYVNKGKLDTSFTGMAKNQYGWWYVNKGKLDLTFTGIAKNPYGTWYLKNGKLDLTFSGKVTVAGKIYTIKNGKVK